MRGRTTSPSHWRGAVALGSVLLLLGGFLPLIGQENTSTKFADTSTSEPSSPKKDPATGSSKSPDGSLPPAAIRFLPNKDNKLIEVRNGPTWEKYVDFESKFGKPPGPPPATISDIQITGTADDDRADLKVTFVVSIHQADQFISVPLFLNEALLKGATSSENEIYHDKDPEKGYLWWIRGRGQHRLELTIAVPLKKQLPSRSLVLSLPASPICHVKLDVAHSSVVARARSELSILDVKPMTNGHTLIDVTGVGTRLDLTWQPNVELRNSEISLDCQTTIRAQVETEQMWFRADQQVKALQGLFDQIVVRIPPGAEQLKLEDPEKQSFKIDPENRQRAIVSFKEKTNSAQLTWTMRLPSKLQAPVIFDGFYVEGARKQMGRIGLATAEGLRLFTPRDANIVGVLAGEFPASMGSVVRAYQFLGSPFRMSITYDEVRPYFQVNPQLVLTASAQYLTLAGNFEFHVDRDNLNEVTLTWPSHKSEGWTIESFDKPGVVEAYSVDDKGQITARLVNQRSGTFSVQLSARRPLKPGEDSTFTLPRPKAASRLSPTTLVLVNAENVDTDLTARGETVYHLLPSTSLDSLKLPDIPQGLVKTVYRVETDDQSFSLRVTLQKQKIRTESLTEAKWLDNSFRLTQSLIYDVSYERLSQVRISVPASVDLEHLHFFSSREQGLTPELLPNGAGGQRQIQLKLGESMLGHFKIEARFSVPFSKESAFDPDVVATLPILGSLDEPFSQTRISLEQSDWFDAEPVSTETWRPQLNLQESWKWLAEGAQSAMPLKLIRSTHANETGSVSAGLVRIFLDRSGDSAVRAQFRVTTRATSLPVQLPPTVRTSQPPVFFWDQQELSERYWSESPVGSNRYIVRLPGQTEGAAATAHLLTIDYQDTAGASFGLSNRLELRAPQLPKCSWQRVIWQAILPSNQHMFTYPNSATPMFRWQRVGLFWSRVSDPSSDTLQHWVTAGTPGSPLPSDDLLSERNGNSYSFTQFDSPKPLVFQSLSSSMVLFLGAGFSLAVGFLMLRVVVLRHVLTLLLMGLIVAVVGLWYAAPLELLFQPMIAGLMFPVVAVLLEGWIRKRSENGLLSFNDQGDFPPMQAFGSHFVVRQSDPNDATVHRPLRDSESSIRVESGSGVS